MSKLLNAALFGLCAATFIAAPVAVDFSSGKIDTSSAWARHGADDPPGDDRGNDPFPDDHGGRGH